MNCLIGLSLTLIAIVAGMLLLAKTQKDNLGNIYKAISYFVIITSFLGFLAGVCCGLCQIACGRGGCSSMEKCHMMKSGCMGGGGGGCMMGNGGKCGKMGMGCGMKGMKKKCKKMCAKGEMMSMEEDEEMEDINVEIIQKQVEKDEKPAEPVKK